MKPDEVSEDFKPLEQLFIQSAWQPIETAPKDGTGVLICDTKAREPEACKAWFITDESGDYWSLVDPVGGREKVGWMEQPDYWMPLPPPPKAD